MFPNPCMIINWPDSEKELSMHGLTPFYFWIICHTFLILRVNLFKKYLMSIRNRSDVLFEYIFWYILCRHLHESIDLIFCKNPFYYNNWSDIGYICDWNQRYCALNTLLKWIKQLENFPYGNTAFYCIRWMRKIVEGSAKAQRLCIPVRIEIFIFVWQQPHQIQNYYFEHNGII